MKIVLFRKWYDEFTMPLDLHISQTRTATVSKLPGNTWHLEIPASIKSDYRLAQLDDANTSRRRGFRWKPPFVLSLQARVSAEDLPGTWGFGLWNDPFSLLFNASGIVPRLPSLPEAAWFFHASAENYLSFRDDLPANGFLAATFHSRRIPPALLIPAAPWLTLTLVPGAAQMMRKVLRRVIFQDTTQVQTRVADWHQYQMRWEPDRVSFSLDGQDLLQTQIAPRAPLCLVIWVDSQAAALPPKGRLHYRTLPNPEPAWMEVRDLAIE